MISTCGASRFITPSQVPTKSSWSPKSDRNVMTTAGSLNGGPSDGRDEALEGVLSGLLEHTCARGSGRPCRLGADRDGRHFESQRRERFGCGGRSQDDQIAGRRRL